MNALEVKEIRAKLNLTQVEFAKRLGVDTKTVQNWESGKRIPTSKHGIIRALIHAPQPIPCCDEQPMETLIHVPLLPVSAQGGTLNDFVVSVRDCDCEKIVSPIMGADFAMSVAGESMSPEYPPGAQVLIKKINEKAFIDWGKVYVLDTSNGTIIKKLMPTKDADKVLCVSINPNYPPFEVSFEHVFGVYRVLMCMSIK